MILTPMDLGTVRSRLTRTHFNHYQSVEEFVADVELIFTNCATFNPVSFDSVFHWLWFCMHDMALVLDGLHYNCEALSLCKCRLYPM